MNISINIQKYVCICVILLCHITTNAHAGDINTYQKAELDAIERYIKNEHTLLAEFGNFSNYPPDKKLSTALQLLYSARVYQEIADKSLTSQLSYLKHLVELETQENHYLYLYLADAYYLAKEEQKALLYLEKIDFRQLETEAEKIHYLILGALISSYLEQDKNYQKYLHQLTGDTTFHQIAAHYVVSSNHQQAQPSQISLQQLQTLESDANKSPILSSYLIHEYLQKKRVDIAARYIATLSLDMASYIQKQGKTKKTRFYYLHLSHVLAKFYYLASYSLLTQLLNNSQFGELASIYMLEILASNSRWKHAFHLEIPKQHNTAKNNFSSAFNQQIKLAYEYLRENENNRLKSRLQELYLTPPDHQFEKNTSFQICIALEMHCAAFAEDKNYPANTELLINLGRYYLLHNQINTAQRFLIQAMQLHQGKKPLATEPLLLLNLAESYRLKKEYAQSLQIYFSMAKYFPMVRQIQDAIQGVYLFEQRDSGVPTVF